METSAITAPKQLRIGWQRNAKKPGSDRLNTALRYRFQTRPPITFTTFARHWIDGRNTRKRSSNPKTLKEYEALGKKIADGDYGAATYANNGGRQFGGYATYENLEKLNQLHKKLVGRGFHTKDDHSMGTKLYWQIKREALAQERVKAAAEGKTQTSRVKTDFLKNAMHLDKTRLKDYYSSPEEMMARAFEAYVHDKLESRGHKSQYLGAKAHNKHYEAFDMKPFPEGEERSAMNSAFETLV